MSKPIFYLSLVFILCTVASGTRNAAADPLPLTLKINLEGIANYSDHPDVGNLEAEVTDIISRHISSDLYLHWFHTQGIGNADMVFTVTQSSARRKFGFTLEINGDVSKRVRYRGTTPDSVPQNGETFTNDLIDAVYEFLFEKGSEILGASDYVHSETDDALETLMKLVRLLDDESRLRYRPEKLDIQWDRIHRYLSYETTSSDGFEIPVLLVPGGTRSGTLRPQIFRSFEGDLPLARFCIHRPMVADPPAGVEPTVNFTCPIEGQCSLENASPAGWADENCQIPVNWFAPEKFDWSWGAAYAATSEPDHWSVPALDVLFDRVKSHPGRFVGFTEFVLRARALEGLDADSFSATVSANGVPILVNGVPADERMRPFDPGRGLLFRFGLENLKFAGREDGCEDLSVSLKFYRDGEPAGDEVILTRGYASLRNAPMRELETPYGPVTWSGEYVAPGGRNETGIFLASALFMTGDAASEASALARLNDHRKRLEGFGWSIKASELGLGLGLESVLAESDELAIVGKIRPPLTIRDNGRAAYGLVVGVEEPSGQLQFTFDNQQRPALLRFLANQRAEKPEARAVVPEQPFVYAYSEERRDGPDWVCRDR